MPSDTAAMLRGVPSLTGSPPPLDLTRLPPSPEELFLQWLSVALDDGVAEPLAMTLATVNANGMPDARLLILKDVGPAGWAFASERSSEKGRQLAAVPAAALSFWWQPQLRAVRVRGRVVEASPDESAADLARRPSAVRTSLDPGDWVLWRVVPDHVEFWQGSPDRRHVRLAYDRDDDGWTIARPPH
ncbi:pyridoxamine 5'-phosphate oxidase family protein [Microbacterium sp. HD4P20]|uniref:pyridoxine/pyridoxamine 5'-phosphate oxidase n=1 Tax=Microbacterium sp. HD4P20 TaxID=2864874 RepID=UPI001C6413BA|nr:pyridoxamine 5'-phosphate oxidase family protein [Microbacterium sp. HD4P20]MCP2635847.1 pyridoxamine 5'-phosphate oxidase family protein [Microbacterium sp. HD4P20]